MTRWHAELALVAGRVERDVLLAADAGVFTAVEPGTPAPPDAARLPGLVLPGLVSGHSHAFQRALRARTQGGAGDFWTWRRVMYDLAGRLDPDLLERLARGVYCEMAAAGITCAGEFHYLHHAPGGVPYPDPNATAEAIFAAAEAAGIRITLLDTCYLRAGLDGAPLEGAQLRFGDGSAARWAERASLLREGPRRRVGAAVHSVRAVPRQELGEVAAWAAARGAPLHAHVSEQPRENQDCLAATGLTPVALLGDSGLLGERFTAVHATHVTESDLAALGVAAVHVCLCPTTERDLADGVGPAARFAEAGARLCLGTDSNAVVDLFEEARAAELDERLVTGRRGGLPPGGLLSAATAGGASALGWKAGELAPGRCADLIAVDLESRRTAGSAADPLAAAVYAASAEDVTDVVVDGETVVRDRHHVRFPDWHRDLAAAVEAACGS